MLMILDYTILRVIINRDNALTEIPSAFEHTARSRINSTNPEFENCILVFVRVT
jgi:hypothetical protein